MSGIVVNVQVWGEVYVSLRRRKFYGRAASPDETKKIGQAERG